MKNIFLCAALCIAAIVATGCEKTDQPLNSNGPTVTDSQLRNLISSTSQWTYYKNSSVALPRGNGSGHPHSHLLTRYNIKASSQLDAAGKVLVDPVFPDSSLIVKELINDGMTEAYAVMFKLRNAKNAGPGGWIWAEYTKEGDVTVPASEGAQTCSGCHSSGIDFTRMNSSHP